MNRAPARGVIYLTLFLDLLGFGLILPQLQYYADHFGATPFQVGLLMAVYSLMQFVMAPVWGQLSDRVGRRPILLVSIAGSILAYVLFAIAQDVTLLFVSRILAGITAANLSAAQAYLTDITAPEERARAMGMIGAAFGVGFILGPALGGVLGGWGGNPAIGGAGALLALVNFTAAFVFLGESLPPELRGRHSSGYRLPLANLPQVLHLKGIGALATILFFTVFAFSTLESTFVLLAVRQYRFTVEQVGWVFALVGLMAAIVQGGLIGPLTRRFGEVPLLITGLVLQAPCFALLAHVPNNRILVGALAVVSVGNALGNPSLMSLLSRFAPEDRRGEVFGVTQGLGSLARVLGPVWGGWSFGALGYPAPYHSSAVVLALVALGCVAWAALGGGRPTDAPASSSAASRTSAPS